MSDIAIKAENVGKLYRLGQIGTGTISQDLNRWWAKMRGKEDPFAMIGETNDRTTTGGSDFVWALKDINFEIKKGEAVGIIGRNGAGKSTLLKLLSKVTKPATGSISVNGRIASLLEVGTGFHPEMTGRENIYLNGAILGMTKKEITRKFDEIVDFSGVERYIDTPVKRYSSGMYVRLAFAVAAHLESEILIVDEVLAVGDAEFQKKCLGKMGDVSKNEGRTVLFVSHNIIAIKNLCTKIVYLKNGEVKFHGGLEDGVLHYINDNVYEKASRSEINQKTTVFGPGLLVKDFEIESDSSKYYIDEKLVLNLGLESDGLIDGLSISVSVCDDVGTGIFASNSPVYSVNGKANIKATIPANVLNDNTYSIILQLFKDSSVSALRLDNILVFDMHEREREGNYFGKWGGLMRPLIKWNKYEAGT